MRKYVQPGGTQPKETPYQASQQGFLRMVDAYVATYERVRGMLRVLERDVARGKDSGKNFLCDGSQFAW